MRPAVEIEIERDAIQLQNWIIWGAMLASVLVYAAILFLLPGLASRESALPAALVAGMAVAAFSAGAATLVIRRVALRAPERRGAPPFTSRERAIRFRTISLINWALSESVAVLGLVLFLLGAPVALALAFMGVAAGLLILHAPRSGAMGSPARLEQLARSDVKIG